jgi:hypothetical protein
VKLLIVGADPVGSFEFVYTGLICTTSNADADTVFSEARSDPQRAIADSGHAKVNRGLRGQELLTAELAE